MVIKSLGKVNVLHRCSSHPHGVVHSPTGADKPELYLNLHFFSFLHFWTAHQPFVSVEDVLKLFMSFRDTWTQCVWGNCKDSYEVIAEI